MAGTGFRALWEAAIPEPCSTALRERVLLAEEAGLPPAVIARRFGPGLSTVDLRAIKRAQRAEVVPCRTPAVIPCEPYGRAPANRAKPPSPPPSTASPRPTYAAGATPAVTGF